MKLRKRYVLILYPAFFSVFLGCYNKKSLAQEPNISTCRCGDKFNSLYKKVKEDYIAYYLDKAKRDSFNSVVIKLIEKVQDANEIDCEKYMQQALDVFHDGHLFTITYPKTGDTLLMKSYIKEIKARQITVGEVFKYFKKQTKYAPIEGIYTDGDLLYAIIKSPGKSITSYKFVAFSFSKNAKISDSAHYKLMLNELAEKNKFEGIFLNRYSLPRYTRAFLFKDNELLATWGGILWQRISINNFKELQNANLVNPFIPSVKKIDDESVLVTTPSFLVDRNKFDSVIKLNEKIISNSKYLVIDLRGNIGGNNVYRNLLNFYITLDTLKIDGSSLVLSSEDNYNYYKSSLPDSTDPMLAFMKLNPGKIYTRTTNSMRVYSIANNKIEKVAIITDRGDMSSAEAFILQSKHLSNKVILVGQPTGGVIDYTSINTIKLACPETLFGYPTGTIHDKLPLDGYNQTGIIPDIVLHKISYLEIVEILKNKKKAL